MLTKLLKQGWRSELWVRPPRNDSQNSLGQPSWETASSATIRKMGTRGCIRTGEFRNTQQWLQPRIGASVTQVLQGRLPLPTPSKLNLHSEDLSGSQRRQSKGSWLQLLFCQPNPTQEQLLAKSWLSSRSSLKCCFHLSSPSVVRNTHSKEVEITANCQSTISSPSSCDFFKNLYCMCSYVHSVNFKIVYPCLTSLFSQLVC